MFQRGHHLKMWPKPSNKYYNSTVRQVTSVIGNQEFAIEATRSLLIAFERFDTLKDMDKFSSWVVSIAINKARDTMRRGKGSAHGTLHFN